MLSFTLNQSYSVNVTGDGVCVSLGDAGKWACKGGCPGPRPRVAPFSHWPCCPLQLCKEEQ